MRNIQTLEMLYTKCEDNITYMHIHTYINMCRTFQRMQRCKQLFISFTLLDQSPTSCSYRLRSSRSFAPALHTFAFSICMYVEEDELTEYIII